MEDKWKELLKIKLTIQKHEDNLRVLKGEHFRLQLQIRSEAQEVVKIRQKLMDKIR